jgi:hypothetical protein
MRMRNSIVKYGYFLLIPLVAVFLWVIFRFHVSLESETNSTIVFSIIYTAGIWMGCYATVVALWHFFPWEHHPWRHLLIEVAIIGVYTNFVCLDYVALWPLVRSLTTRRDLFWAFFSTNLITYFYYSTSRSGVFLQAMDGKFL